MLTSGMCSHVPHPTTPFCPVAARPPSRGSAASPLAITATLCPSWSSWWPSASAWACSSLPWPSSPTASWGGGECPHGRKTRDTKVEGPIQGRRQAFHWMDAHVNDGNIIKVNDFPPHRCVKSAPLIKSASDSSVWTLIIIFTFLFIPPLTYSVLCLFIVFFSNKKVELQPCLSWVFVSKPTNMQFSDWASESIKGILKVFKMQIVNNSRILQTSHTLSVSEKNLSFNISKLN